MVSLILSLQSSLSRNH